MLKQCFSIFNRRLLNNDGLMPKYLLYWPGRQVQVNLVREKYFTAKGVRSQNVWEPLPLGQCHLHRNNNAVALTVSNTLILGLSSIFIAWFKCCSLKSLISCNLIIQHSFTAGITELSDFDWTSSMNYNS